jgi:hypothetical protein
MASKKVLVDLDLSLNQLKNAKLDSNAGGVSAGNAGQIAFDSTAKVIKIADGTVVQDVYSTATQQAIINKSFDANGTGNSITNLEVADFASGVVVSSIGAGSASELASSQAVKSYVDAIATGLSWKAPVDVVITSTMQLSGQPTSYYSSFYAPIYGSYLLTGQADPGQNGIYEITLTSGQPVRRADADTGAELESAAVFAKDSSTAYVCTANYPGTNVTFVQFSGTGTYTAGTGLSLSGNQFYLANTSVTAGTYNFATVTVDAQGRITAASSGSVAGTFSQAFTSQSSVTVTAGTHGKGTAPIAQVYETVSGSNYLVDVEIVVNGSGDVTFNSNTAFTGTIKIA